MATLYELSQEYQDLLDALENATDDETIIEDTIASTGINERIEDKFEGYGQVISQVKADTTAVDVEIKRLTEKKRTYQNNLKRLKTALLNSMAATDTHKVKTSLFSFSIRNTRSVQITNPNELPEAVLKQQKPKPDKTIIKKMIEAGENVPGAEIELNESLTIR